MLVFVRKCLIECVFLGYCNKFFCIGRVNGYICIKVSFGCFYFYGNGEVL